MLFVNIHGSADVKFLFSEMCLDQALTIHDMMEQEHCPYHLLNAVSGMIIHVNCRLYYLIKFK